MLALLATMALAGSEPAATVGAGIHVLAAPPSLGAGVNARAALHLGRGWSVVALAAEGVASPSTRTLARIGLDVGKTIGPLTLRAGFAHVHETPWATFVDAPIASVAGVAPGIVHRSGFEVGVGADRPVALFDDRLGVLVDLGVAWLPDRGGPPITVALSVEATLDLGRRQGPP